jgi:hypothetical protein
MHSEFNFLTTLLLLSKNTVMNLSYLKQQTDTVRKEIIHHPLYPQLQTLDQVRVFTQYHVFAVWDFMSLLKSLQRQLTCVTHPWIPVGSANTRYLINEIVTGEESDIDAQGNRTSHFELYLKAMQEMGASAEAIEQVLLQLKNGFHFRDVTENLHLPAAVKNFCSFTFDIIEKAPVHVQAAVFTFGREDLIPAMFHELVIRLSTQYPEQLRTFRYYLERHIEVDGEHHSLLALQMVEELCGEDTEKWIEATNACVTALSLRRELWNGVLEAVGEAEVV